VLGLENLGRDTEADVAGLLDAAVDIDISIVDDEEEQTRHSVVAIASLVPDLGDCAVSVTFSGMGIRGSTHQARHHQQGYPCPSKASCRVVGGQRRRRRGSRRFVRTSERKPRQQLEGELEGVG
jgi:hypothetical protein